MKNPEITIANHKFLTIFALFWVLFGWLSLVLALAGFFHTWPFFVYLILFVSGVFYCFKRIKFQVSKEFIFALIVLLAAAVILSVFTTPSIFSGRDQGSISEAAIRLAQNHQLEFSTPASEEFFRIYGPGKALNFPGFYYSQNGNLATQFPLPYISWLAAFYSVFKINGLVIANAVLFYLFLLSFYSLSRVFLEKKYSIFALVLILTSFSFSWFLKFTLSENMTLALLWISIFSLVNFLKKPGNLFYGTYLSASLLLVFARIEGILFFISGAIIIALHREAKNYLKANYREKIIFPAAIFSLFFIWNFAESFYFYKEIAKALLEPSLSGKYLAFSDKFIFPAGYILKVYSLYGIIGFLFLGIGGIIYFFKKRRFDFLVPFFVILPSFIYLIDSHISSDHPWMLRRFVFSILPALILYAVLFLAFRQKEKTSSLAGKFILTAAAAVLLFANLPSFLKYFAFSENKGLLAQTEKISRNFSANDLVLVDRLASGDGWSMIGAPMNFLYGKNTAYFFNPSDLEKTNTKKFDKIYLIVPDENIEFYRNSPLAERLKYFKDYSLETVRLEKTENNKERVSFPAKTTVQVKGKIFEITKF